MKILIRTKNGAFHHPDMMARIFPRHRDFVDSTAVARLNGYAGGHGGTDQLSREIENLGLSAEGKKVLAELVRR